MVADWMRVGFVHGVMNTDNMSILGLTIDYGPYGWIDNFDPDWTPNTTDAQGRRYRFGQQPQIALLEPGAARAGAGRRCSTSATRCRRAASAYAEAFVAAERAHVAAQARACASAGTTTSSSCSICRPACRTAEVDMTIFFRALADIDIHAPSISPMADAFYDADKRSASGRSSTIG